MKWKHEEVEEALDQLETIDTIKVKIDYSCDTSKNFSLNLKFYDLEVVK